MSLNLSQIINPETITTKNIFIAITIFLYLWFLRGFLLFPPPTGFSGALETGFGDKDTLILFFGLYTEWAILELPLKIFISSSGKHLKIVWPNDKLIFWSFNFIEW